ncbi:MAG: class I SAM-dependent methyltransferase [Gammaproteobacteria bacterium]|jgi:phosphatidylethanolamine/phosphatidyl-N-methylethanolamine N-methyltransferase
MTLRTSYTFIAPLYDALVAGGTARLRRNSLELLGDLTDKEVLLCGVGTGLDLAHLPPGPRYTGVDLTPAMLKRAARRAQALPIELREGDVMALDLPDNRFDVVIMHLILAVVPQPERALSEAARVCRPGGHILILDKFLRPNQLAPVRRLVNPVLRRLATRTDVVFEPLLAQCPTLSLLEDRPAVPGGWFRHLLLTKRA